ncbi:MAG: 3-hydroxyacyl-CoA dehydrogenase [Rhodobacteraceae bacterium]|nr:3-hydroxyacyl-CoA dehydrogenase [Paracoccaceae bacterium]MBR9820233.1 3-hydroxyacyl-CoA dehydrogenase [Paracoccaceae bacterium]
MTQDYVRFERDGEIAVLAIDNPPVNAMGHEVRTALSARLDAIEADDSLRGVVLMGTGRTFCAGADIRQLAAPPVEPTSPELFLRIEAMAKPVVAALHGPVLGAGFELALACAGRVAAPGTELGLPEVKLGLIPGAGGTFRLPAVIGAAAALDLIAGARRISAAEALDIGLLSEVASDHADLRRAALACARGLLDAPRRATGAALGPRADFEAAAERLLKRARGAEAPHLLVEAIGNAFTLEGRAAQEAEQALFQRLREGPQSAAMRHLFFAERAAARLPEGLTGTAGKITRAAVIGAGTMGGGIAMCFADAGLPVTLIDKSAEGLAAGLDRIRKNYEISAKRGRLSPSEAEARLARITPAQTLEAARDADLVIEAVFEDMSLKQQLFRDLDGLLAPEAVLATNTSSLDIDEMAAATGRPQRVVGLHFFSPANVMTLLEVVRGARTDADTLATALALAAVLGKQAVIVGNCPGFVGNRILRQRHHQAEQLLQQGARPEAVDRVITGFGMAMGPFQMADLAGLDVARMVRRGQGYALPVADALCDLGRFGQKTGKGYYLYEDGRTPRPDPEVDQLIADVSDRLGITPRSFTDDEIRARIFYPMVNEAARILDEGIAARPSDIDVTYVHGYGFPAWRGGLMYWADGEGLGTVARALAAWAEETGEDRLRPAPLLKRLAREDRTFAEWQADRNKES